MEICVSLSSYHGQRRASWIDAFAGYDATVQRFHCCRQDRRACGQQHCRDEPSAMGWDERRVVHMPSAGRAKIADCDAQECHWHAAVEAVCAGVASGCPRSGQLLAHCGGQLLTRRGCSNRMQMRRTTRAGCQTRRSCSENELRRELSPELFWGSAIFRAIRGGVQFYE